MTWQDITATIIAPLTYWEMPEHRIFWVYLITAWVMALGVYVLVYRPRVQGKALSFIAYLFPKNIYFHKSALTDYRYFLFNRVAFVFMLAPIIVGSYTVAEFTEFLLLSGFGAVDAREATVGVIAAFTFFAFVAYDFAIFFTHYIQHRVPYLWEFHKVHHAAEAMTPMVAYRIHPLDDLITGSGIGIMMGIVYGLYAYFYGGMLTPITMMEVNVGIFLFNAIGFNLRHTHIWLAYRGWLGHVLISPAHHQIHHSVDPVDYDRNFGAMFAVWDWMFGSLRVPEPYEEITFGLGETSGRYHGIWRIYLMPFVDLTQRMKGRPIAAGAPVADAEVDMRDLIAARLGI